MTNTREELNRKLNDLSTEQLKSVYQFVESLEYEQQPIKNEIPVTNEDIDRVVVTYRQQNKPLPIGLAKGEFTVNEEIMVKTSTATFHPLAHLSKEEQQNRIKQVLGAWRDEPEIDDIFAEIDRDRYSEGGRQIDSLDD